MTLIERLKQDHASMLELLENVRRLGLHSAESRRLLLKAKEDLVKHLATEDRELYPPLRQAAAKDEGLLKTLRVFTVGMEEISPMVMRFFAQYASQYPGPDLARDFGRIYFMLRERIRMEEAQLHREYEKHCPQP